MVIEEDYPAFTGAFDFLLENDGGEQIHVRGAAKDIVNYDTPNISESRFPSVDEDGEFGVKFSGTLVEENIEETDVYFCQTIGDEGQTITYLNFFTEVLDSTTDESMPVHVEIILPHQQENKIQRFSPTNKPIEELRESEMIMAIKRDDEILYEGFHRPYFNVYKLWADNTLDDVLSGGAIITAHQERQSYVIFEARFIRVPIETC